LTKPTPKYTRMLDLIRDLAALEIESPGVEFDMGLLVDRAKALSVGTGPNNPEISAARARAVQTHKAKGDATRKKVMPHITRLRKEGVTNYAAIAKALNKLGVESPKGGVWYGSSVRRVELGS
jgi:hypothetical protein